MRPKNCLYCKRAFEHEINIFCSTECRDKMYALTHDPLHKNMSYQGRGPGWTKRKREAYERDQGICQVCGHYPRQDEIRNSVHHIKPFREFNGDYESANALSNLITTCEHCHAKLEHGLVTPIKFKDAWAKTVGSKGRPLGSTKASDKS